MNKIIFLILTLFFVSNSALAAHCDIPADVKAANPNSSLTVRGTSAIINGYLINSLSKTPITCIYNNKFVSAGTADFYALPASFKDQPDRWGPRYVSFKKECTTTVSTPEICEWVAT